MQPKLAAQQPKFALCSSGLLQHTLHADTALHALAVAHSCQPLMPGSALTHMLLPRLFIVRMQHVPPTNLEYTRSLAACTNDRTSM